MRFLNRLRNAYKLTNLTYPQKHSLNYASVAIGKEKKPQKCCLASKVLGRKLDGDEAFQEAFAILSLLRDNTQQVEMFSASLKNLDNKKEDLNEKTKVEGGNIATVNTKNKATPSSTKDLSFDREMLDLNKVLLNPGNLLKANGLKDPGLSLSTNSRLDLYDTTTIPLHLNTLINGAVSMEPKHGLIVPEFNEYLTSLVASLCSAALVKDRKYYSTENTINSHTIQKYDGEKKYEKVNKIDPSKNKIIQDLLKNYDKFQNEVSAVASGKKKDGEIGSLPPGPIDNPLYNTKSPIDKPQESSLGLLDSQLYKKSLKEAEIKRKKMAKNSAACKETRPCQPKKPEGNKGPCKSKVSKCSQERESGKNFESVTEPSSSFKCGSKLKSTNSSRSCGSGKDDSNDPCKVPEIMPPKKPCKVSDIKDTKCASKEKTTCGPAKFTSKEKLPSERKFTCGSGKEESNDPCKVPAVMPPKNLCGSAKSAESKKSHQKKLKCIPEAKTEPKPKQPSKCGTDTSAEKKTEAKSCSGSQKPLKVSKCAAKSESKSESSIKCSSNSDSKLENPCEIPPITKLKSPSKPKRCTKPSKPKCSTPSKCSIKSEDSCQKLSESKDSKCFPKCSSNSSMKSQNEKDPDSQNACKRAAKLKCSSETSCGSEPKNPCKSSCDGMNQTKKVKCGRPPKGDTRPRCKKGSKCGSKTTSPKKPSETKCGSEIKPSECEKPKCGAKTCAPSPKASEAEIKPKSRCNSNHNKPNTAPSSKPPERKIHTLSNFSMPNLIFRRNYSDECPDKPKSDYKPKSKRSNEYRLETCDNFSWKATKARKKRVQKPKNCYPEETLEFCPDTACYKVYAETSGKVDKKRSKKKPKATKIKKNEALCTGKSIGNPFNLQKVKFSTTPRENEEALIKRPHSICTRKLVLPELSDNDALICVDSVALSDTDIHVFETGARNVPGLSIGNEAAGVVTEVGCNICNLKPGDHVVLESGVPCFHCDLCKMGRYNICNNLSFKGFLKNHCSHPASFCHKICPAIPLEQAALVPQLALGCNACYQAGIKPNSNVVIIGSCAMTVCAAICALSMGAENVCVICGMPETRVLVEQYITQKVDSFDANTIEKGIVRTILSTLGTFPDIVINCSVCTRTMNAAIIALKPTGVCVVAGFLSECASFNIMDALMKEIQIIPSFRSKNMFPIAINLLESGRAPLDCLIANCEFCKWNELEGAFKLALSEGNNGPRKAIVKCQLFD
ncbi:uncharacterized protein LOC129918400 [Episyrphus balteatus]|uniref:uncharacterized protein LOC129918400 n=1 Tax=Episyrphus balteatus TaxID=286459 RepID=UPI002484FC2D|nr:uncharacterized protein LOC129918400 [Episyrphus balteatus]